MPMTSAPEKRSVDPDYGLVTVGTTATLIRPAKTNRQSISLVNEGARTVYLGQDATVTIPAGANPGYSLLVNGTFDDDYYDGVIYGIVSVGTADVTFWED